MPSFSPAIKWFEQFYAQASQRAWVFDLIYGLCGVMIVGTTLSVVALTGKAFTLGTALLSFGALASLLGQIVAFHKQSTIHYLSFLFSFLFLSVSPIARIGLGRDPVYLLPDVTMAGISLSVLFSVIGLLSMLLIGKAKEEEPSHSKENASTINFVLPFAAVAAVILAAFYFIGDTLLSSRQNFTAYLDLVFENPATSALMRLFLALFPFFLSFLGLIYALRARRWFWFFVFAPTFFVAVLLNNPFVNARFLIFGLVLFCAEHISKARWTRAIAVLVLAGVLVAPLFHGFRTQGKPWEPRRYTENSFFDHTLLSMDYDAFDLLCYTVLHVEEAGKTKGENILGSLLFFVPRSLWPDKPVASSLEIYETMTHYRTPGTNNLSTPLVAEGFFAFGWAGAIGISLIYWVGIGFLVRAAAWAQDTPLFLFRCVLTGFTLILLRGTLMVAWSSIAGATACVWLAWGLFNYKKMTKFPANYANATR